MRIRKIVIIIINVIRIILGVFFILSGIAGLIAGSFSAGFFIILSGVTLIPLIYKKINFIRFKYAQVILPISFLILSVIFMPSSNKSKDTELIDTTAVVTENESKEDRKAEIESLRFDESEIEIDIKEIKKIILKISPNDTETGKLEFCTSDNKIALLEKISISDDKTEITLQINPVTEGNCEIFVKLNDGIQSNKVKLKVIDNEIIKAEEQAKKSKKSLSTS